METQFNTAPLLPTEHVSQQQILNEVGQLLAQALVRKHEQEKKRESEV
ncbi:hypothetical protein [Teredinibacter sp. KSP-S5-2]|nr:hypothetical protein [Teredinibacter sp. KSP-S5-2]WNO10384.1 hypothetical protein P5V12_04295 [Teredinibacter sp. KSP-S5-2]